MKHATWESEAAMLTAFVAEMTAMGFRCVPESCGHDVVCIAGPDVEAGLQRRYWTATGIEPGDVIAVEGKLHANLTVLRQATPPSRRRWASLDTASADFYVVVLPRYDSDFADVAHALGIACAEMRPASARFGLSRPAELCRFDVRPGLRCFEHPVIRPTHLDVKLTPGLPSPRPATPWKIAAVRFCLKHDGREFTSKAFEKPLSFSTFQTRGWLQLLRTEGRSGVYTLADHPRRPDREYPEIVAALAAEGAA